MKTIDVTINGKKIIVDTGSTVSDALTAVKVNPETVLVKRSRALIPQDEVLNDGDILELITVISGG